MWQNLLNVKPAFKNVTVLQKKKKTTKRNIVHYFTQ